MSRNNSSSSSSNVSNITTSSTPSTPAPPRNGRRGRPPGSKNKTFNKESAYARSLRSSTPASSSRHEHRSKRSHSPRVTLDDSHNINNNEDNNRNHESLEHSKSSSTTIKIKSRLKSKTKAATIIADDDDEEDDQEEESGKNIHTRRKHGKNSSKINEKENHNDDDEEEEGGEEAEEENKNGEEEDNTNNNENEEEDGEEEEDDGTLNADERESTPSITSIPGRRGGRRGGGRWATRGKARGGPSHTSNVPLDPQGNPRIIENDEIVLPTNPKGETKVTPNGELLGGRQYRVRTFTVKDRGQRHYMLSTEPARCMGFRDSYLLFQKHKRLYKIIVTEEEKYDLIERQIIPHSYKGRAIGIVTARSVYREFGAKIVVGGRRIIDDYDEENTHSLGYREGELADPSDRLPPPGVPYNKNQYVAWHGASAVYHQYNSAPPTRSSDTHHGLGSHGHSMMHHHGMMSLHSAKESYVKRKKIVVTDENWMLEHATATSEFNHDLLQRRKRTFNLANMPSSFMFSSSSSSSPGSSSKNGDDENDTSSSIKKLENGSFTSGMDKYGNGTTLSSSGGTSVVGGGNSSTINTNGIITTNGVNGVSTLTTTSSSATTATTGSSTPTTALPTYLNNLQVSSSTPGGVYEPHTGLFFYPSVTQPKRARYISVSEKLDDKQLNEMGILSNDNNNYNNYNNNSDDDKNSSGPTLFVSHPQVVVETVVELHSPLVPLTGLGKVPSYIFEGGIVSDDIKRAILNQQSLERVAS